MATVRNKKVVENGCLSSDRSGEIERIPDLYR